jgi:hypothetical protein
MPEIAIRLDPEALPNPQADLRYLLPEALEERAPELLREDGYDYDSTNRMLIFLATSDLGAELAVVLAALEELEILGNRFRDVTVAIADETHCSDNARYRVVAPRPGGSLVDP